MKYIPRRVFVAAYFAQLAIPLVFFENSVGTIRRGDGGWEEKAIACAAFVWLAGGLGGWFFTRDRNRFIERMYAPILAGYVAAVLLCGLELGVRLGIQHFDHRLLFFRPDSKSVFDLARWHIPGVSPQVTFSVNSLGLRGPLPPSTGPVYKIIAVGGSTTECAALDDSQAWPQLVMQGLNESRPTFPVWVGNAGVSGLTTVDHIYCLRRLPTLRQADMWIFLIGVNDLQASLNFEGAPTQAVLEERAQLFLEHAPVGVTPVGGILHRSWLVAMLRTGVGVLLSRYSAMHAVKVGEREQMVSQQSERRTNGPVVSLPDLRTGIAEYAQRIRELERECSTWGKRCLFLTQPSMWRSDLAAMDQNLLWLGGVGRHGRVFGYLSSEDLRRAMDAYNQTLMAVCQQDRLECYDLAAAIPKDTSAFYDDVHFNIGGARMVADFLTTHLSATAPFTRGAQPVPSEHERASRNSNPQNSRQ